VSEEASFHHHLHFAFTPSTCIFHLPHEALSCIPTSIYHIKPVYTPLALRDWFRAAPRNPLKPLTRLRLVQHRAEREKIYRPSRCYQEAELADKRSKMLTMWVTEDEHQRLLERCDGKQLAAWMRQTCLDEKPARAGKLPSISPALLRQLAGMGNNLNQIARQVNGGSGHDRVQVVAALMAINAGLERLRHAVLEKGADDDR
jgi:hypothetical protein